MATHAHADADAHATHHGHAPWLGRAWHTTRDLFAAWLNDACLRLGASVSFFGMFSLAPLLAVVVLFAAAWLGGLGEARTQFLGQMEGLVGSAGTETLGSMIDSSLEREQGLVSAIVGVITLLIGTTGVFIELRYALDKVNQTKE
jgi:membrane protein